MIITKLHGGLGNQMFQYAIGRNIAIKQETALKIDISYYLHNKKLEHVRNFDLINFRIQCDVANDKDMANFKASYYGNPGLLTRLNRKMHRSIEEKKPIQYRSFIKQPDCSFYPEVLDASHEAYLTGNWQSEKYFIENSDIIRNDFVPEHPLSQQSKVLLKRIKLNKAVSLHVRRGDYISNKNPLGTCNMDYYLKAADIIKKRYSDPVFFIFSDEIDWVRKNLNIPFKTVFVSNGTIPNYEEVFLMSNCNDNIVANSSFSWWGAWLNKSSNKTVIAPRVWLNDNRDEKDIVPKSWVRV